MVLSLNRIFSVNENFTPVIVLRPEPVEILRMEAEHEIISENRIIVLEHSCNLPLVHSPEIKFHGFVLGELRLREELIELGDSEIMGHCPYRGRRTVLLALIGVSGNVRSCDGGLFHKFKIDIRLIVPGVYDDGTEFGYSLEQGLFVHQFAAGGVDEEGAEAHLFEE